MHIEPFNIRIPQADIDDLRQRIALTRWPDEISKSGWNYGASLSYLKDLASYWQNQFDWRAQEESLNAFHHFRAHVDGTALHFIHQKGKGKNPFPLVITHGWPGSFVEMLEIIPLLTDPATHGGDPADSFDVVVPSLPGYGFSEIPHESGMNPSRIANLWARLIKGLGYQRYGAQGGDWGASVSTWLALSHPTNVTSLHLNYIPGSYKPYLGPGSRDLSASEREFQKDVDQWEEIDGGYGHVQRTKPQTLAYGLNDSPIGLAAWIIEKFRDWSDCTGDVEKSFSKDQLLTNVMVYWFTKTINSSMRLYLEARKHPLDFGKDKRVEPPCGIIHLAKEAPFPPREWIERSYNIRQWTEIPHGGHFAAMEVPELFVEDIRKFFRAVR